MIDEPAGRWGILVALSATIVLALVPWFSAAAVAPLIAAEWRIDGLQTALLTVAVQVGFSIGALVLALDRCRRRRSGAPAHRDRGARRGRWRTLRSGCSRSTSSRQSRFER